MKTCLRNSATAAIAAALTLSTSPAYADSENAAVVINDDSCVGFVPDTNGALVSADQLIDTSRKLHQVSSRGGGTFMICTFDVPEDMVPDEMRKAEGFTCGFRNGGSTTDSRMQVSPGGNALLICRKR